jgi:hypothetical protein
VRRKIGGVDMRGVKPRKGGIGPKQVALMKRVLQTAKKGM